MKDQHGRAVPADLVTLPDFTLLLPYEQRTVFANDWWEADGVLLWADEPGIGGDDPRDAGLDVDEDGNLACEVLAVDDCLKRGNAVDGFYHA